MSSGISKGHCRSWWEGGREREREPLRSKPSQLWLQMAQ